MDVGGLRGEESTFPGQNCDENVIASGDFLHCCSQAVIEVLIEGIELLGLVEGYDSDFAAVFERYAVFGQGHGGYNDWNRRKNEIRVVSKR